MRIGMGYDVHRLVQGRDLIIGGVNIPHEKGLLGHSDADVLLHAIMDALLGASSLGDIGKHFPDTDDSYKGISSVKLRPHIDLMRKNIADTLGIDISQVNVKATTEEGLGFTGTEEGISAQAICLLTSPIQYYEKEVSSQGGCGGCTGCPRERE